MTFSEKSVLEPSSESPRPPRVWSSRPWFSTGVLVTCVAVYLLCPVGVPMPQTVPGLWEAMCLYGPAVTAGQWWRALTAVLVHGGPLHVALNMWVLTSLGFGLERGIGALKMALVSLVGALGAAAMTLAFGYNQVTVGASGMILSWAGVMLPLLNRQGRRAIGGWLLQIAVLSLLPGISWQGHLGGFLAGLPCGAALRLKGGFWPAVGVLIALSAGAVYFAATRLHEG
jgi:membrane associated rhomboid family serine protease